MRIPDHLAHLRRDRRGLPVPLINNWGPHDDPARYAVRPDPSIGGRAAIWYDDDPAGEEEPDFAHQSLQRQRRIIAESLCQVCGRHLDGRRELRLLPISSEIGSEAVDVERVGQMLVFSEPWLCRDCALFAQRVCPALIRRRSARDLRFVPVPPYQYRVVQSVGWVDPLPETKRTKPVMWLKVAIPAELLVFP